jgi:hypothetical protein
MPSRDPPRHQELDHQGQSPRQPERRIRAGWLGFDFFACVVLAWRWKSCHVELHLQRPGSHVVSLPLSSLSCRSQDSCIMLRSQCNLCHFCNLCNLFNWCQAVCQQVHFQRRAFWLINKATQKTVSWSLYGGPKKAWQEALKRLTSDFACYTLIAM